MNIRITMAAFLVLLLTGGTLLHAGCSSGGSAAPSGGGSSTPIPIELPSAIAFPSKLAIGASATAGTSSNLATPAKTAFATGAVATTPVTTPIGGRSGSDQTDAVGSMNNLITAYLSVLQEAYLDMAALADDTAFPQITSTPSADISVVVDYGAFDNSDATLFKPFTNSLSGIDCSTACARNKGELADSADPALLCFRVWVRVGEETDYRRFMIGKFTELREKDSPLQGAGCFRASSTGIYNLIVNNEMSTTTDLLALDANDELQSGWLWDGTDLGDRVTEAYFDSNEVIELVDFSDTASAATIAAYEGKTYLTDSHVYIREQGPVTSADADANALSYGLVDLNLSWLITIPNFQEATDLTQNSRNILRWRRDGDLFRETFSFAPPSGSSSGVTNACLSLETERETIGCPPMFDLPTSDYAVYPVADDTTLPSSTDAFPETPPDNSTIITR